MKRHNRLLIFAGALTAAILSARLALYLAWLWSKA